MNTATTIPQQPAQAGNYVIGYWNANDWPLYIAISELGLIIKLDHGIYLKNSAGQKINDPYFERFFAPRQLSKEVSETPVPLVLCPRPQARTAVGNKPEILQHAHPVLAVTEFKHDAKGVKRPVLPAPLSVQPPMVNASSIKSMSMEDARRLGFVGKPRLIAENYGVDDTGSGAVPANAPQIKVALESTPKIRQATQLPPGLVNAEGLRPEQAAAASAMVQSLATSARTLNPESNGFMNQTFPLAEVADFTVAESQIPQPLVMPAPNLGQDPALDLPVAQQPPREEEEQEEDDETEEEMPEEPAGFDESQISTAVHQPSIAAPPRPIISTAPPKPIVEQLKRQKPVGVKAVLSKDAKPIPCPECGETFKYPTQLQTHARSKHPDQFDAIMATVPESA